MVADSGAPGPAPPSSYSPAVGAGQRLTLHLGVLVQPYRSWTLAPGEKRRKPGATLPVTTGDVAGWLETKYGVMEAFYRVRGNVVARAVEESLSGALESILMGHAVDPWGAATQTIQHSFRDFISSRAIEQAGIPGVPTKAALMGVNHRRAHPYSKRNPRRPSFRDTGLYMASFRSWVD